MIISRDALSERSSAHLDLIRGLAAFAVLAGHVRALFFQDWPDLDPHRPLITAPLYAVTGLGHDAVVVFFVLSGFFVGGSVLRSAAAFSWRTYLINRVTRLYLVLVPALVLTGTLDGIARTLPQGSLFFDQPIHNFADTALATHASWPIALGNLGFLQGILVPTFGSNGPLWSLANEFWYYLLFPAAIVASIGKRSSFNVAVAVLAVVVAWLLPWTLLVGFVVWILGAAVAIMPAPAKALSSMERAGLRLAAGTLFLATLAAARIGAIDAAWIDLALGLSGTACLFAIVKLGRPSDDVPRWYSRATKTAAGCSYSLYAIHFPVVLLIRVLTPGHRWMPTPLAVAGGLAICLCAWSIAFGFAHLTERHTDVIRRRLARQIQPTVSPVAQSVGPLAQPKKTST